MQFQAKLAGVSAAAGSKDDAPIKLSVKLEPLYLNDSAWLFNRVGEQVIIEVTPAAPVRTPLEEAIEAVNGVR